MKKAEPADFPKFEAELLKTWEKEQIFAASLKLRQGAKRFRFYDGPPFMSGEPHYGHVEQSAIKDAVARYKTMQGYYVPRRTGADTHGLPVEFLVEKDLGFKGKQDILKFGIDKFNQACRDIVFRYEGDFNDLYRRLGRWDDPKASYATLDDDYIESVWWVFKSLFGKGLIYQGHKSVAYCPRCATPLSNFEVNDGYRDDIEDPSVFVKFKLAGDDHTSLLAWTTTPWTLPVNAALAVDEAADYVTIELTSEGDGWQKSEKLILAKKRLDVLDLRQADYKVIKTQKGKNLVGLRYLPFYPEIFRQRLDYQKIKDALHQVYADDSVSLDDGTGVLHIAPAYGESDFLLGQRVGIPPIESLDKNGFINTIVAETKGLEATKGLFFKAADSVVIEDLEKKGYIFAAERFKHTYPFCWRCETPLYYYATPSWFVAVSTFKDQLVATGQQTNWVPDHIKTGRFIKWLEGARDWAISRNRFWGAPMPVWQCSNGHNSVIGSLEDLRKQAVTMPNELDLHRPGIDAIEVKCADCGEPAKRIEEVFDCWFESGSMPYGQDHYPFENKADFDASFPADFVVEAYEQTHLWFYTLHVLATALFDQPAYKNLIASGLILGEDGRKLSKRLRNYASPNEVFDEFGADVFRFFALSSPLMNAGDTRLSKDALRDVQRNVFMTLWNVFSFFTTYAEIDDWRPSKDLKQPDSQNVLDQWMLARLNETIAEVTKQADGYMLARATRPLIELVDDLSNWYVRRSRRRFWKSEDDGDKASAYATLHYVLLRLSQLLAPWSPFISDKLWRELTAGMDVPRSVHLSDWPEAGEVDKGLLKNMAFVRGSINLGLAKRAEAGIKVRQPLAKATLMDALIEDANLEAFIQIVKDELNVKEVEVSRMGDNQADQNLKFMQDPGYKHQDGGIVKIVIDTAITPELKQEGMVRDLIRQIQAHRKSAGLEVSDRIDLTLGTAADELKTAIKAHEELIKTETLATQLSLGALDSSSVPVRVDSLDISINLKKA